MHVTAYEVVIILQKIRTAVTDIIHIVSPRGTIDLNLLWACPMRVTSRSQVSIHQQLRLSDRLTGMLHDANSVLQSLL